MGFIIILAIVVYLIINGILAGNASDIAADKGYDKNKWFHMCFWLGLFAYLVIAGMPDLKLRQQLEGITCLPQNASGFDAKAMKGNTTGVKSNTASRSPANVDSYTASRSPANVDSKTDGVRYIQFGSYPQNESGTEANLIEWQVLKQEDGNMLMISRYALDAQPYNVENVKTDWESCSLRRWLNQEFYDSAFSEAEKKSIIQKEGDNVSLLSCEEAQAYFSSNTARLCSPTQYASQRGAYSNEKNKCWWWLRSLDYFGSLASRVFCDGSVLSRGSYVDSTDGGVRPAVWVRLS